MAQAIVDPAELRRFALGLKQFNTELQDRTTQMVAQLHALGTSWRDQENQKFAEEFEDLQELLDAQRDGDGFKTYDQLNQDEIKALSDAVNALSEPLSRLTAVVVG